MNIRRKLVQHIHACNKFRSKSVVLPSNSAFFLSTMSRARCVRIFVSFSQEKSGLYPYLSASCQHVAANCAITILEAMIANGLTPEFDECVTNLRFNLVTESYTRIRGFCSTKAQNYVVYCLHRCFGSFKLSQNYFSRYRRVVIK